LGSNWYIRGDIGYGQTTQATVVPQAGLFPTIYQGGYFQPANTFNPTYLFNGAPSGDASSPVAVTRGNIKSTMAADYSLGFGYRINDWFRVEADYTFSKGPGFSAQTKVYCPGQATAVSNYTYASPADITGVPNAIGYQYDWSTCNGRLNTTQYNNTGIVMGYADLGHWGMFSPYIGLGGGINVNTMTGSMQYNNTSDGSVYAGPKITGSAPGIWVAPTGNLDQAGRPVYNYLVNQNGNGPQIEIGPQNWARTINTTKYTLAASAAAGLGIQISQSATLDLGLHLTTLDLSQGMKQMRESVSLGVRYNIN
jgi:hypothetical protein